jgi:hypothetical protein
MRQLDLPRSDPPTWTDELRTAVLWPDKRWTAKETMDLITVTSEFGEWLHDPRPYESHHKYGWLSIIEDLCFIADQIGPELKSVLGNHLDLIVSTANSIRADLEQHKEKELKALLPIRLMADRIVYDQLKSRWPDSAIREAAWVDLIKACRDPSTSYDTLALRRDLFWQVIKAADYALDQMSRLLGGILGDAGISVTEAKLWLGDVAEDRVEWQKPDQYAGLSEEQQLSLCQRLLTKPPTRAHRVIWIAFNGAGPGIGMHTVGPVSFWDCEWVRGVLEHGGANWNYLPAELRATQGHFTYRDLPQDRDVVLARIDLEISAFTDPVRIASEQAEAVIALASFRLGVDRWQRLQGHLDFVDGHLGGMGWFMTPVNMDDLSNPRYAGYIVNELDKLAPRLTGHLPIVTSEFTELVGAVRWWQQATRQAPLAALLLHVRILELVATRVGTTWPEYLESYMRTAWTRQKIVGTLMQVVREAVHSGERLSSTEHQQRVEAYRAAIVAWDRDGGQALDPKKGLDALSDFAAMFPTHTSLGRQSQTLNRRLASSSEVVKWRDELATEWNLLAQRLRRVRNALAHGGPLQDEGAESVHEFGQRLAAWSLSLTLEGVLDGNGIARAHDEYRQEHDTWWNAISCGSSVADTLLS